MRHRRFTTRPRIPRLTLAVVLAGLAAFASLAGGTNPSSEEQRDAGGRYLYRATWNGIPVARAELRIAPDPSGPGDAPRTMHLRGSARTNAFLDLFWRMRNRFDAVIAVDPPAPGTYYLRQNENRRRRETWIARDEAHARLVGKLERPGKTTRHGEAELHRTLHDPASISYLIRMFPADLREPRVFQVFEGWKTYNLTVTPEGEDTIRVLDRTWRALKLHLGLQLVPREDLPPKKNKPPKVQSADLWVSADAERVLLRMEAPTFWGKVAIHVVGREDATDPAPPATETDGVRTG